MRKVVGNVFINILGNKEKKVMRWKWAYRDYIRWIEMRGRMRDTWWSEEARGRVWIQGVGKHGMFQKPNSCIWLYPL